MVLRYGSFPISLGNILQYTQHRKEDGSPPALGISIAPSPLFKEPFLDVVQEVTSTQARVPEVSEFSKASSCSAVYGHSLYPATESAMLGAT
jgi:hypothetical protein